MFKFTYYEVLLKALIKKELYKIMKKDEEPVSIFVDNFGSSPNIKILDYLISGFRMNYSKREISYGSGVKGKDFKNIWENLLKRRLIVRAGNRGNVKLYTLNKKNYFVQEVVRFDYQLLKREIEKAYNKKVAISKVI